MVGLNKVPLKNFKRFFAPAKINLFLKVLSKRNDGYHNLQSVFHLIDLYDEVFLRIRSDKKITVKYSVKSIDKKNDLCLKAAKLILKDLNHGVDIKVKKNIPIGGGLGGGSSDAATVMIGLNKLLNLKIDKKKLLSAGLSLGADVPFFINGVNGWVEGIGEKISPISVNNDQYLLIIPNISISTKSIFTDFKLTNKPIPLKIASSFSDVDSGEIVNDLHGNIFKKYPKLRDLFAWLEQYGNPRITGTGSSLFLKCNDESVVKQIYKHKPKDTKILSVRGLSIHPHLITD
jgi:4-diphosphocytidyl-2-C-methyl-D-erythritol kinase